MQIQKSLEASHSCGKQNTYLLRITNSKGESKRFTLFTKLVNKVVSVNIMHNEQTVLGLWLDLHFIVYVS